VIRVTGRPRSASVHADYPSYGCQLHRRRIHVTAYRLPATEQRLDSFRLFIIFGLLQSLPTAGQSPSGDALCIQNPN
jgi:hypothetical protein